MAFNISELFKNTINDNNINQSISNAVKQPAVVDAINSSSGKLIANMLAGDTFTGLIKDINNNTASILLSDGSLLNARLTDETSLSAGMNATFIVEQNIDSHVQIKALPASEQHFVMIEKALEASNLPVNESNINIVNELLNLNMPINSAAINNLARNSAKFPNTNLNTIANLVRLDIPVTDSNITQFEAYKSFNGQLEGTLSELENNMLKDLLSVVDSEAGIDLNTMDGFNAIISELYGNADEGTEVLSSLLSDVLDKSDLKDFTEKLTEYFKELLPENKDFIDRLNENKATVKDLFTNLTNSAASGFDNEKLKEIIGMDAFKRAFHEIFNDTMKLKPQNVSESEDAINQYYNRIRKNIEKSISVAKDTGLGTEVNKNLSELKSNIDFMNDLNKNMTYFQMPVKFSESEGNGELYVFTNKKNLANKTDNISALLHLDMENLGPMDVFVKLNGKAVSTNFVLESEELLNFVYSHIDELNRRLEALGYSTHFEMKVAENENKIDFVKDFIESDINRSIDGRQYIFDSKV
ncbi:MAG: flagellar hook-length control protein FliK [Lachnospira sp.]